MQRQDSKKQEKVREMNKEKGDIEFDLLKSRETARSIEGRNG